MSILSKLERISERAVGMKKRKKKKAKSRTRKRRTPPRKKNGEFKKRR